MKTLRIVLAGLMFAATVATVTHVAADDRGNGRDNKLRTSLKGFNEVPIVSTGATGKFRAEIVETATGTAIEYELSFSGLGGVVAQSHIHLAQKDVNGGIVLWLCQGTARAPAQAEPRHHHQQKHDERDDEEVDHVVQERMNETARVNNG